MKKILFLFILISFVGLKYVQSQENKQAITASAAYGLNFDYSIYVDMEDAGVWATPEVDLCYSLGYEYAVAEYLRLGTHVELEQLQFESSYTDERLGNRIALGFQFLSIYPQTPLHAELGGFFNLASINCDEFTNRVNGFDYGLLIGPAYQYQNLNIAFHFRPSYGYYFIADGTDPESALVMFPKFSLSIGYFF